MHEEYRIFQHISRYPTFVHTNYVCVRYLIIKPQGELQTRTLDVEPDSSIGSESSQFFTGVTGVLPLTYRIPEAIGDFSFAVVCYLW